MIFLALTGIASTSQGQTPSSWHFEDVALGQLPAGWKSQTTHAQHGAPSWEVRKDPSAPSPDHVLALIRAADGGRGGIFNICWTPTPVFRNGEIRVSFKAITGREDQGGGIMWRVRDRNNYYVARFNPLEDNFRLYTVHEGHRRMLASARVSLLPGWHRMHIVQQGDHYTAYLDGRKLLTGNNDLFPDPGGVGVWTKADALTAFDDFSVTPR
ncbi:MAG TPA: hypothetical protein ENI97_15515 [Gammaproteobacteria bacterium]|nr:hypothetical protein [Gammaproteobacteria bacterium]